MYTIEQCVDQEVHCNVGTMINELLKNESNFDSEWFGDLFFVDDEEGELIEPYEFWMISRRLAEHLQEEGHPVTYYFGTPIWGRPTTGQWIGLDCVIINFVGEING